MFLFKVKACEHIDHSPLLFAAPQCLGYTNEFGKATPELCFPPKTLVLKQLRRVIKALRARSVFVASDNDHMIKDIEKGLKDLKVNFIFLSFNFIKIFFVISKYFSSIKL